MNITPHAKNQVSNLNDKGQFLDTTKNEQMLELFEKEYKAAIIKCFSEQLYTHLKQVKI